MNMTSKIGKPHTCDILLTVGFVFVSCSIRREELLHRSSSSPTLSPSQDLVENGHSLLGKLLNLDHTVSIPQSLQDDTQDQQRKDHISTLPEQSVGGEEEEQEFEFRLFSTAPISRGGNNDSGAGAASQTSVVDDLSRKGNAVPSISNSNGQHVQTSKLRIRLRSPSPVPGDGSEGRFVKPFRGWQYYFSTADLLLSRDRVEALRTNDHSAEEKANKIKKAQFEDASVDGGTVLARASLDWVSNFSCRYALCVMK